LVYLDYSQEELNAQYNQATLVPDITSYMDYWATSGSEARNSLDCMLNLSYGSSKVELLDIFSTIKKKAPIHVHIHGGAWRQLSKEHVSYPAPHFVSAGANFIPINFGLAPEYALSDIVDQIRTAINWVWQNANSFDGDREQIFLSGVSSGAHLAANLLSDDWQKNYGLPADIIKGAVLASGPYDLDPVRLSVRNKYLNLNQKEADNNNPLKHIPKDGPKIVICWGDGELNEFQRQGQAYADEWQAAGNSCQTIILKDLNHFDVANQFGLPESQLFQAILTQMSLAE
jgi:arylformamidase